MSVSDDFAKIRDSGVRALAESGSSEPVDVLIELEGPRVVAAAAKSAFNQARAGFTFLEQPDPAFGHKFRAFGGFLQQVGARRSHPLELSNAYSATLAASSLPEVTSHPLVVGIDANMRRR